MPRIGRVECDSSVHSLAADPDVPKPDVVAVMLQVDVPGLFLGEPRHVFELASGDQLIQLAAAQFELHHFYAVEPVLDAVAVADELDLIPFADRFQPSVLWSDQGIERAGGSFRIFPV